MRHLALPALLALVACRNDLVKDSAVPLCPWYADADEDGFGDPAAEEQGDCAAPPAGFVEDASDCDDSDAGVHPEAQESCNDLDDDCDGSVDEDAMDASSWYADADGDGFGDPLSTQEACDAPDGHVADATDCDDGDDQTYPDAAERCDGADNDCDGEIDEELVEVWYQDLDGDGFGDVSESLESCDPDQGWVADSSDCDDLNSSVHPGAEETCDDQDNDCDGSVDEDLLSAWYADADGDGYGDPDSFIDACEPGEGWTTDASDCDDSNSAISPAGQEACNGVDDDCDGLIDDEDPDVTGTSVWYADADGDSYGDTDSPAQACEAPDGHVADASDCDDGDAAVNPAASEICDDQDNDCDGDVDEDDASDVATWYADADQDGYGDLSSTTESCDAPSGYTSDASDCDDHNDQVHPGAAESCDGVDEDCDGSVDEDASDMDAWYADTDGDGYGDADSSAQACEAPSGHVSDGTDCDDGSAAIHPGASETCDGVDQDCDGDVDEDASDALTWCLDADGDSYGNASHSSAACDQPEGYVADCSDCDDGDASSNPGASEVCDGADNDCDGDTDEEASDMDAWYADLDGDGYGDVASAVAACAAPSGHVLDDSDCDDGDAAIHPNAAETCNGTDDDCDGATDEEASDALTWYIDADGDGYGDTGYTTAACSQPSGYSANDSDCDDGDASSNPGASEICDGADNDCDGATDEGLESDWYLDYDGDGWGADDTVLSDCEAPSSHYVAVGGDCDDTDAGHAPGATPGCDGDDYDCDGHVDSDADGDGYADAACGGDDCDDSDASLLPEAGGGCAVGLSCLDILQQGRSVGDGDYTIDPDGYATGLDPFEVACDMSTDGGGWTAIEYDSALAFQQHFTNGDGYQYLPDDFSLLLEDEQVQALQDLSAEGFQVYEGLCEHVIHYYFDEGANYEYAVGFMFFDGTETPTASSSYSPYDIAVTQDGCAVNGGEAGDPSMATIFEISSVLVPVVNMQCRDCGDEFPEEFGSTLTDNPAWLR